MTALATETTTTARGFANGSEDSQVFHIEHRCGRAGHRVELARYTIGGGEERILFGQRVDGVVRFLPGQRVVLVASSLLSEDSRCRSREALPAGTRPDAARPKRQNGASEPRCPVARRWEDWS
jgi:hypothetical protein